MPENSSHQDSSPQKIVNGLEISRRLQIGQLFTPATPINDRELFAGRLKQVGKVVDVVCQRGQHAIVYGERGVGKTSMSNVLASFLHGAAETIISPRVVCDSSDSYSSLWQRVFSQIHVTVETTSMGLRPEIRKELVSLADQLPKPLSPDIVRAALERIGDACLLILIIDEFDRFAGTNETRLFADTIKILSDYAIPATIVLVGVANSVEELIAGHESVLRNLVQVPLPRMSQEELKEIITRRLPTVRMTITDEALNKTCLLSRGLPHYTHLIAQHSAWRAIECQNSEIDTFHLGTAMNSAIENSQHTIQRNYHLATMSSKKDALYAQVLLACALANCDEFGYFAAADVRGPMTMIMRKPYDIASYSRHLKAFGSQARGRALQEIGTRYQRRFRFRNPLMQPYVIMRGVAEGLIDLSQVRESAADFAVTEKRLRKQSP